jgi:S-adenosylmethionine/arginine decarboxylase-like enzyme
MTPLVHKHIIIRSEVLNPPVCENTVSDQIKVLIDQIGMKLLMGPYAKYVDIPGNRGLTVASIIETSHIVMHTWDECDPAIIQLDVYTCGPFDPNIVFKWLDQYQPIKIDYKYIDREFDLHEIPIRQPQPHSYTTKEIVQAMDDIMLL